MSISDRIRNLRENNELTRKDLSEIIDYSEDYIYKIETGKRNISRGFLNAISEAFNMPRSYFFKDDEIKYNSSEQTIEFAKLIRESNVNLYGQELDNEAKENIINLVKMAMKFKKEDSEE